ncbi:unnamed protein product [Amoebophrya sp. A25]|nr:unnamed protein product [Amoebophrya sp. A25]|eukprot:GSA25T00011396001.1
MLVSGLSSGSAARKVCGSVTASTSSSRRWLSADKTARRGASASKRAATVAKVVLPSGRKVERPLSAVDIAVNEFRQKFSSIGANTGYAHATDLYAIFAKARRDPDDYRVCLHALNICYNFGLPLAPARSLATRLLALALRCNQVREGVELVEKYRAFLAHPPDPQMIYTLMGALMARKMYKEVRGVLQAVREDWCLCPRPNFYSIAVEAMLQLDPSGDEAVALIEDAARFEIDLPVKIRLAVVESMLTERSRNWTSDGADTGESGKAEEGTNAGLPPEIFEKLLPKHEYVTSEGIRRLVCLAWQRKLSGKDPAPWRELRASWKNRKLRNWALQSRVPEAFLRVAGKDFETECRRTLGDYFVPETS